MGLIPRRLREAASDDAGCQKREEREPVLRVGDEKGADRRQEVKVVACCGDEGGRDRILKAEPGCEDKDEEYKRKRDGGWIDVEPAAVQ